MKKVASLILELGKSALTTNEPERSEKQQNDPDHDERRGDADSMMSAEMEVIAGGHGRDGEQSRADRENNAVREPVRYEPL